MAHRNIPIFIPHLGCPNQCVFCNQCSISGCRQFSPAQVTRQIDAALSTVPKGTPVEIAFFGGSFTGIDRELMIGLLEMAQAYVDRGAVDSIRLSTRPDYISQEILEILARYSVRHIELGLQSMNDGVLQACRRGHTAAQAEEACRAVVAAGFSLTGQMMIGLPGSS
ncbi:MAG: radical SAM protein, partial [Clostridia bacterium]|nr:radical SAM protein [Clostridia bacterium]